MAITLCWQITASCCEVSLYNTIVYFTKDKHQLKRSDLIKSSSCRPETNNKLFNIIKQFNNEISLKYITTAFKEDFSEEINNISQDKTNLISGISLINKQINIANNGIIKNLKVLGTKKVFHIKNKTLVHFSCLNCYSKGQKEIKAVIGNPKKIVWLTATAVYKTKILVSNQNIDVTLSRLDKTKVNFTTKYIEHPERYYTDINKINYYKLSTTIPTGTPIKTINLIPISLVTPSIAAKVLFRNGRLSLAGVAMPLRSGKYHEMIPLRHKRSRKTIYGRVTGPNEVTVEL